MFMVHRLPEQDGKIEADNGRIYRLNARGAAPAPALTSAGYHACNMIFRG